MDNKALSTLINSDPLSKKWIEKLFDRMLLTYGKKFTDLWDSANSETMKSFWADRLSGFSGEELAIGVAKLEGRDWPPTLPEFMKLCRPPADPFILYCEAVSGIAARARGEMGKWSHPAIFWAAVKMTYELNSQSYSTVHAAWNSELLRQYDRGEWEPIPTPYLSLPTPGKSLLSKENAAKMVKELNAAKIFNSDLYPRRWYLRILKRYSNGDKSVTPLQLRFAMEAEENHRFKC